MIEYLKFWLAKLIVENAIPLTVLLLIGLSYLIGFIVVSVKQARCNHMTFRETRACDAICLTCNKNLGFIGTLQKARKKQ